MSKQKICFKISAEKLSEFLFNNKVRVSPVEFDHDTDTIKNFLDGAGPNIAEAQAIVQYNAQATLEQIRIVCQKTQD